MWMAKRTPPSSMKPVIVHWIAGPKAPSPAFREEKPPVARVVRAWQTASNAGMSSSRSTTTRTAVSAAPTSTVSRAVSTMRGSVFSTVGPGASAVSTSTPQCRRPRTRTNRITMPSPPSHWVSARQSSSERGSDSTSAKMVAPVVEMPEADSKTASTAKAGPKNAR